MDQERISLAFSISLLDRHITFSARGAPDEPNATFVVEWPEIDDASLNIPRKHIRTIGGTVRLQLIITLLSLTDSTDRNASPTEAENCVCLAIHCAADRLPCSTGHHVCGRTSTLSCHGRTAMGAPFRFYYKSLTPVYFTGSNLGIGVIK